MRISRRDGLRMPTAANSSFERLTYSPVFSSVSISFRVVSSFDDGQGSVLYLGDCLDVMRGFDAGCVDLTVTSPPYDNLRTYNGSLTDWTEAKWKAIIAELFRVTKQGGVVVWVVGDATINGSETGTSFRQALHAMECGFRLHDTMIYYREGPPLSHNRYEQNFEFMFIWSKGRPSFH